MVAQQSAFKQFLLQVMRDFLIEEGLNVVWNKLAICHDNLDTKGQILTFPVTWSDDDNDHFGNGDAEVEVYKFKLEN